MSIMSLCHEHYVNYLERDARLINSPNRLIPHDHERHYWQREMKHSAADLKHWSEFHSSNCSEAKEKPTCTPPARRARSLGPMAVCSPSVILFCALFLFSAVAGVRARNVTEGVTQRDYNQAGECAIGTPIVYQLTHLSTALGGGMVLDYKGHLPIDQTLSTPLGAVSPWPKLNWTRE